MARRKKNSIEEELKKIEAEERMIEAEERRIEEKEDMLKVFEELGLMRWKSYYVLTAGAILLLSLTFVTALWVINGQIDDAQISLARIEDKIDAATVPAAARDWCPEGRKLSMNLGQGNTEIMIVGEELIDGVTVCRGIIDSDETGIGQMQVIWDQEGNIDILT